jgi:hypothetical protein
VNEFVVIPSGAGCGGTVAINPSHITKVTIDHEPHAIGQETGRPTLRLYLVDGTITSCRGIENIKEVLAKLDIEGRRPKVKEENAA